ncbi:MAG: OsmC family protein [Myxococcaceae bacterium]|nr:OsmC family protein [Myxococcaceae bacterium]
MATTSTFDLTATRDEGYRFLIRFEGTELAPLVTDEPAPLGKNEGPNPSRLLAAALVNCLAASLLFALGKKGVSVKGLSATAHVEVGRNDKNRLRIERVQVLVTPTVGADASAAAIDEAIDVFEDFCVVTQSVRAGLPVDVRVEPVIT